MKEYAIKTQFIFEGYFYVKADNKQQAIENVDKHCGAAMNRGIHSTLPDELIDWDFPMHPEKHIKKAVLMKKTAYKDCNNKCPSKKKRGYYDCKQKNQTVNSK